MIRFPNCKINLGLHITEKRGDGYHNIETIFFPIPWKDVIEIYNLQSSIFNDKTTHRFQIEDSRFISTGLPIPGDSNNNLCIKAWELLKKDFPHLPEVSIHLHKIIPMGAGLGGGSADGAFVLKALNEKFSLNLSPLELIPYALALGSDCPFFIYNEPCFATGRGEIITPISLDLSNYKFILINPGIHISTKWAFEQLRPTKPNHQLTDIIQSPIEVWKDLLINDFEAPVMAAHPEIAAIKNELYNDGAVYASMTGSGSTLYGIYHQAKIINTHFPSNYLVKTITY